jgi:phosphoglycerate dehydrogenase-like enzyme
MTAIAVLDDYQNVALSMADWSAIQHEHHLKIFNTHLGTDEVAIASALVGFDVIAVMRERTPITAGLIARLPNLKLLVTTGHYNAAIDMAACKARGITVCGAGSSGQATAELAFGLLLALARCIPAEAQNLRTGTRWQTTVGTDIKGKTLGIIGLGRLGAHMARFGQAFGMSTIAWSQNLTAEKAAAGGAELAGKDELLKRSDFISIHTRLSERTHGLIAAREFALMKPTAYLINTSRGPIVDEPAMLSALEEGRIAGAGLDTFDIEPLPLDHPLRKEPRALLTPHLGYVTQATYRSFYAGTVAAIQGWLSGAPVNVIN